MKYSYKNTFAVVFLLLAFAAVLLPVMSVYCIDGESGTIPARIFNLPEFSPLGFLTLIAPILLIVAALLRFPQNRKRLAVIVIVISDAVCTAIAAKNAYAWLSEIGTESVRFHPICVIYGLILIAAALIIALPAEKVEHDE